jgi:phosphohistidine phosphatase
MKTLLLLRHAKSSWQSEGQRDFERPLNERGLKAAPLVGGYLQKERVGVDLVLASPAERARHTATLVVEAAQLATRVRYDERIYEASVERLMEVVAQIGEEANAALLVGHNPGLTGLLETLTGVAEHMPTAALAKITLDVEKWSKVGAGCGQLDWLVKPKELAEG